MNDNKLLSCVGLIVLGLGLSIVSIILNAWALRTLWGWFLVPIFEIRHLKLVEAMGISCIVSFLITHSTSTVSKEDTDWSKTIAFAIVHPTLAVGLGWLIKQFM